MEHLCGVQRSEKAERIHRILDELHPDTPIPLDHTDAFTLTVAVVLSAQTTDKKVNEVTPALFEVAGTPELMANMKIETVQHLIRQIGLAPQKAKSLVGLGQGLMQRHGGQVPDNVPALLKLPGVGPKTAGVVMSQAFGHPAFPVDTHIFRLASRWGLSRAKTTDATSLDLMKLFPRLSWSKLHLQMIYFGRVHCPALYHDLAGCPICGWAATKKRMLEETKKNTTLRTSK